MNKRLQYAGAYRPMYHFRNGEVSEIKADKMSAGGSSAGDDATFTNHEISLQKGDAFYIFSDGFADQFSAGGKKLLSKAFREKLGAIQSLSMEQQKKSLDEYLENWKAGAEQTDDVLVVGVRV